MTRPRVPVRPPNAPALARAAAAGGVAVARGIASDFLANPVAAVGLALLALIVAARDLRAADLAAEPLRSRADST